MTANLAIIEQPRVPTHTRKVEAVAKDRLAVLKEKNLQNYLKIKTKKIASTLPLICDANCPLFASCDKRRDNGLCKDEVDHFHTTFYALMSELNVSNESPLEISTVIELAVIDVLMNRITDAIRRDGVMVRRASHVVPAGGGQVHVEEESVEHPMWRIWKVLGDRRSQVLKELAATREQKKKFEADTQKSAIDLISEMAKAARARKNEPQVIEARVVEE